MTVHAVERLAELLRAASRIFVFTGAGMSTNSGIPDFRGPQGVWTKRQPVYFDEFVASEDARREYWDFKLESWAVFRDARPNSAHQALVDLERLGKLELLVTQNVDGLHQAAGTSADKLVELHGTNAQVECIGCGLREAPERAMEHFRTTREPPCCQGCGELLKPAVVMFGQSLDLAALRRAARAAEAADLILAVGSSLVVTPAADLPLHGARRGTPYVILNQGETPHDPLATLKSEDDVSVLLPAALATLRAAARRASL